jgi:hypothetical protein
MNGMRHFRLCAAPAAVLGLLAAAAPASADIFATFDTHSTNQPHLRTVNVTTGAGVALPAGVNDTSASQVHASLSPDRRHLVFLRSVSGTVRVLMVDLVTGQSADLFNGFEAAADPPNSPTFSTDGTKVLTGRRLEHLDPSKPPEMLQASFTQTDVTHFPNGPFPHQTIKTSASDSTAPGRTLQPTRFGSSLFAFGIEYTGGTPFGNLAVQQATGTSTIVDPAVALANPTVSQAAGVVVYEKRFSTGFRLVFRPLAGVATAATTELPALVNARDTSVSVPALSSDGRYLAFIRRKTTGNDGSGRLFVWDTQTQLLLNSTGISDASTRSDSAIALNVPRVPIVTTVKIDTIGLALAQPPDPPNTKPGMIVQKIEGVTTVLGRRAPRLRLIGQVHLGVFTRSRRRSFGWNRKVNGRRLARGDYLVTGATFTRKGQIRDLATPVRVRIR